MRRVRGISEAHLDKLERIERKVRRAIDYSDQLQTELDLLKVVPRTAEVDGSLEFLIASATAYFQDRSYRAVSDDKGSDPFGKLVNAPMSSYDPGTTRRGPDGLAVERSNDGVVISGEGLT